MNLKGKKAAVLGLSIEGVATTRYLLKAGARVTVCDQNLPQELEENLKKIKVDEVLLQLGQNYLKNLNQFEILFRTPGMPLWHPELIIAKKAGVQISSQTKLFFDLCPCPIIGVTGTKGKGTTASLIFEILKTAGKNVFLGGNIGNAPTDFLDKLTSNSWVVLELSSFQLEDLKASPHLAVILNITSDHLFSVASDNPNYHLSQKDYLKAKENIVKYQKKKDYAVLNFDYQISRNFSQLSQGQIYYFSKKKKVKGAYVQNNRLFLNENLIGKTKNLILPGAHNWENVTAAICVAFLADVPISAIKKAVFDFKGLEHRLEFLREMEGIRYYNDSFSTTPETAIAAIRAFKKPIILIAGGSEKGLDYAELGKEIANSSVKTLILIGQIAGKIEKAVLNNQQSAISNQQLKIIKNLKTMKEIVKVATHNAELGDVVVLSPASASFDMFKNYKERGRQFKNEVAKI